MRPNTSPPRIVVVDDDPAIASTLAAILDMNGFSARSFTRPTEVLSAGARQSSDRNTRGTSKHQLRKLRKESREMTSILTTWKDIGKYLGKGTRTVQRWEKELALPVRRTKQVSKSVVLAIPAEIDAWVQSQRFRDGQLDRVESERTNLFRTLKELRSENRELRSENRELQRQLALERARGEHG